jgi:hypothetical protein
MITAKGGVGASSSNPVTTLIEESGGLDMIESLQNHASQEVYEKYVLVPSVLLTPPFRCLNIIENYFANEKEE